MNYKGCWTNSAKNIKIDNNLLECELQRCNGTWEKNELTFSNEFKYSNIDGRFQWVFDNSILFLVINMKKNTERWDKIQNSFENIKKKYNCHYVRIEGVDGYDMENDVSVQNILKPIDSLIGTTFYCREIHQSWKYDGTILKSFPGLHLNGHKGTKGLTMSNLKCFHFIKQEKPNYNWYCILEDDSEINENVYNKIVDICKHTNVLNDIIVLDKRGKGGACAILYNQKIISNAIKNLHPLSNFSITNEEIYKRGVNLWDWKLWVYLDNFNINNETHPLVPSGSFPSEINK